MTNARFLLLSFIFFSVFLIIVTPVYALVTNLVNFNATTDLTDYFNSDGSAQFTNVSTGGIGNTGAINVPLGTTDIWTTKQGYSVTGEGDIYTFSAFFKIQANGGYGGLGFSNVDTNTGDFQGQPVEGIGMSFHGGGGSFVNNRTYTDVSWPPDLVLGNWYKMIFKVTAKGSNTYDLNFQIWNSDSSGTLGTMKTEKILNGVVNSDLGSASTIHGFFAAAGSRMEKIDDFLIELEGGAVFVEEGLPVVTTTAISSITGNSASSGGNVTSDQGAAVTARGVCWSTTAAPTTAHSCTTDGTGTGSFTSAITSLSGSTTYYVRAYATNSEGTSYGSETSFTTDVSAATPTPSPTAQPSSTTESSSPAQSNPQPPTCSAAIPNSAPSLFQIDTTETTATLYFTPVSNSESYYISYATETSAEQHGTEVHLTSSGVQKYTITLLSPNTTYYFKVRGQNGCMPGSWSAIQSKRTQGSSSVPLVTQDRPESDVLISESETVPEIVDSSLQTKLSSSCSYIVQPGDSLWKIAESELEDGKKYSDIRELNGLSSSVLRANQELKLPCAAAEGNVAQAEEKGEQEGTKLALLIKDANQQPIEGVDVTLHSKIQIGKTDKDGIVRFENVESGDHRVILAYNDYTGEQKLVVDGSQKEQTLTLQVQMSNGFSSRVVILTMSLLLGVIFILFFFLFLLWRRRKKKPSYDKP